VVRVVALFVRLLFYPFLLLRRARAALPSGWIALELKGTVEEHCSAAALLGTWEGTVDLSPHARRARAP